MRLPIIAISVLANVSEPLAIIRCRDWCKKGIIICGIERKDLLYVDNTVCFFIYMSYIISAKDLTTTGEILSSIRL